jgi:hypothetical protein
VRRRRTVTLLRLKEEARIALRDLVRSGEPGTPEQRRALAERLAPSDEEELFALGRNSPTLRPDVRAALLTALERVLDAERQAIAEQSDRLELMDRDRCCGG